MRQTLLFLLCFTCALSTHYEYSYMGLFDAPMVAFTNILKYRGENALFYTSFTVGRGFVSIVPNIAEKLENVPAIEPEIIARRITWPNEVDELPEEMFGHDVYVVCGGFLAPLSQTGAITILDMRSNDTLIYEISEVEANYFYHMAIPYDVDGDGLLDLLTAKVNFPQDGHRGKLVWLRNPGNLDELPWKESVLFEGPEVFFRLHDFDGDGIEEIIATEFFQGKLSIYWRDGDFIDPSSWSGRVIDDTIGSPFDVIVSDLNNDGKVDLCVTNHEDSIDDSAVFAYEIPSNIRTGQFIRHILAKDFETLQPGDNQASPGSPRTFFPYTNETDMKPYIAVSGDGTQKAHLLRPVSQNATDWSYTLETIVDAKNTVGLVTPADANGDGKTELYIPCYDSGELHIVEFL